MTASEHCRYVGLIRQASAQPLEPLPVELPGELEALVPKAGAQVLRGIKAVLFDLYGTLFISAAGEIAAHETAVGGFSAAASQGTVGKIAVGKIAVGKIAVGKTAAAHGTVAAGESAVWAAMHDYFRREVNLRHKAAQAAGNPWPEVRVETIWAAYKGTLPGSSERSPDRLSAREMALHYELAVNPAYPMPYAAEILRCLSGAGLTLGIISNAQFFTPLLFDAFFNASPAALGFDPGLCIYSFEEGQAKPSPRLFAKAAALLAMRNIQPHETLFVGNDMRNDILPAAAAGFATALFAGDSRSLRIRKDDPACAGKKPCMVIKYLAALVG